MRVVLTAMSTAVLLAAVLGAAGCAAPGAAAPGSAGVAAGGKARVIERKFEYEPGGELALRLATGGDILVAGWERGEIHIEARITGRDREKVAVEFEPGPGRLVVKVTPGSGRWSKADCRLLVKIPQRFDVSFETLGGDVEIRGVSGGITGRTLGGDMAFYELEGTLRATTLGGDVKVAGSTLDGRVRTLGGDIEIKDVTGDLKGSSLGGDVKGRTVRRSDEDDREISVTTLGGDLRLDHEGKKVRARTLGGDVAVERAEEVSVSTMGGDIEVGEAPAGARVSTLGGDITIASAGGYVRARTMGGDIRVASVDGWVKAATMGGDISVTTVGDPALGRRDVELKSMGGDIELTVPSGAALDFDIEIRRTQGFRGEAAIRSDFPLEIDENVKPKTRWGRRDRIIRGTGSAGGGGHLVKIRTINGNVTIRQAD